MTANAIGRRGFLRAAAAAAGAAGMQHLAGAAEADPPAVAPRADRPNIILFLVDDMGWQDTSVPFHTERTAFNDHFHTPNMERLADSGIRFTDAYAYPLCSPTRVSIMTGHSAARHRVTQWTLRLGRDPSSRHETLRSPTWRIEGLQPPTMTLPRILKGQGYHTIHCGKAHFGAHGTKGEDPCSHGFDVNIAGHCAGGPGSYHGENNFSAAWRKGDRIWDVPGLAKYHGKKINLTEALTLEANAAVERAVESGKPFYLYMSHYAIHAPWEADRRFVGKYLDKGVDKREAVYASMIESMDHSLGSILSHIEKLGVAESTIVLFASDNGGVTHSGRGKTPAGTGRHTHNAPLRAGKCSVYEGGIRVPMIVSWAKRRPASPLQQRLPIRPGGSARSRSTWTISCPRSAAGPAPTPPGPSRTSTATISPAMSPATKASNGRATFCSTTRTSTATSPTKATPPTARCGTASGRSSTSTIAGSGSCTICRQTSARPATSPAPNPKRSGAWQRRWRPC